MATRVVFSDEELQRLREFPEINRAELIRYFTLAAPDEMFVRKFRGPNNVLGAAVQLSTLPWLGFVRVEHLLQDEQRRDELDGLLVVDPYLGRTPLAWLGTGPTQAGPAAVKGELEKLAYLRRLDAHTLELSALPAERRRFLAGVGRRLTAQALQRREAERRYPILLTLIAQSAVDVLDETLLLFDQALSARETVARAKMNEALAERAKGRREPPAVARRDPDHRARPGRGRRRGGPAAP